LLVLDGVDLGVVPQERRAVLQELRSAASRNTSVLIATQNAEDVEEIADAVSFLHEGRLVLDDEMARLRSRFRRIRYRNEIVLARSEYGNELDEFDAVRVRVRGWGVDAIVSNFDDARFDRFRQIPGVVDVEASGVSLEEIVAAVAGEERHGA
jgi:ABC-type multidrug transport system ATPase subunit